MAEVALRPRARADLKEIARYSLKTWGKAQASKYTRAIHQTMKQLAKKPELGRRCDVVHEGLRVYPSGKHLVFYLTTSEGIDVIRVLHERRDLVQVLGAQD
jgi:toxin ParE1/3/4